MSKNIIYIVQPLKEPQVAEIAAMAPGYDVFCSWKEQVPAARLTEVEIVLGGNAGIINELLALPNTALKWVQVHSAGIDYLDLPQLERQRILLSNASGLHGKPIAEHVMAVLLAEKRAIFESVHHQLTHTWTRNVNYGELQGANMLIFGTGHVGSEIARLASAFGITVTGVNRSGHPAALFQQTAAIDQLDTIIGQQDIIVNILPLTQTTIHFFDQQLFAKMKDGVQFLNVGRGPTVDTTALIAAVESEKIGYAFLDVFEEEPLPTDSPLWTLKNTLITAHIAGMVPHFKTKVAEIYKENLRSYLNQGTLSRNAIDYKKGF